MTKILISIVTLRNQLRRFFQEIFAPQKFLAESAREKLNIQLQKRWDPHQIFVYELIRENRDDESAPQKKSQTPEYIVFIDIELDVDWIADGELTPEAQQAVSFAESVSAKRCEHLPKSQILEFKRLIGQAIVNGLQGAPLCCRELAGEASRFLRERTIERSRIWTLVSAHFLALLFSFVLAASWALVTMNFFDSGAASLLWSAVQGGLLGAYLSILQKTSRGERDAAAGVELHLIEVVTKLSAGGILGGIAFVFSQSVHAPPSLRAIAPDALSLFLFGVAAGMFERVIPRMVSAYSNFENEKETEKT